MIWSRWRSCNKWILCVIECSNMVQILWGFFSHRLSSVHSLEMRNQPSRYTLRKKICIGPAPLALCTSVKVGNGFEALLIKSHTGDVLCQAKRSRHVSSIELRCFTRLRVRQPPSWLPWRTTISMIFENSNALILKQSRIHGNFSSVL